MLVKNNKGVQANKANNNKVKEEKMKKSRHALSLYAVTPLPVAPLRVSLTTPQKRSLPYKIQSQLRPREFGSIHGPQPSVNHRGKRGVGALGWEVIGRLSIKPIDSRSRQSTLTPVDDSEKAAGTRQSQSRDHGEKALHLGNGAPICRTVVIDCDGLGAKELGKW